MNIEEQKSNTSNIHDLQENALSENSSKIDDNEVSEVINDFERLNPEQQERVIMTVQRQEAYMGPIPRPEDFEKYERILPGAADRILSMAEKQALHRQRLEEKAIFSGIKDSRIGQYLSFIIAMSVIFGGFFLVGIGKDAYGIVAIISALASLVGVFVYGKRSDKKELEEKR